MHADKLNASAFNLHIHFARRPAGQKNGHPALRDKKPNFETVALRAYR
jgi:hypothetical protein